MLRLCPKKYTAGRKGNGSRHFDIEDEVGSDEEDIVTVEAETGEEGEESDSVEDYETDDDETNSPAESDTVRVNFVPTNGGVVLIKDLSSWIKSQFVEI